MENIEFFIIHYIGGLFSYTYHTEAVTILYQY